MNDYADRRPTYGGWRQTRGVGIFGLSEGASLIVMGTAVFGLLLAGFSLKGFIYFLPGAAFVVAVTVVRFQGESLGVKVKRRVRFWWGSKSRFTSFDLNGVIRRTGGVSLPSLLAPTRVVGVKDDRGALFGIVHDQRTGLLTATLKCDSRSTWLVDGREADIWVANWHGWLADLGIIPLVAWVAVTVETAPEPGSTLAELVTQRIDPTAPVGARELLLELVRCSPERAVDVDTRVSITFDPSRSYDRLSTFEEQAAEVNRILVGMESGLGECGVAVLGRATPAELAGVVRTAFDPKERGNVNRVLAGAPDRAERFLNWSDCGPEKVAETWKEYQHDSGWSVSYAWQEAPRQQVMSDVLIPLMGPAAWPKRVTMLYQPLSAEHAARTLESEVNKAVLREGIRAKQGRDETARDRADRERADAAAREEALGAGVVLMSMYVTVTVTDYKDLPAACAHIESIAQQSKIRLKRLVGSQAAGFVTTLPAGIYPAHAAGRARR